jgi:hypothetical protein
MKNLDKITETRENALLPEGYVWAQITTDYEQKNYENEFIQIKPEDIEYLNRKSKRVILEQVKVVTVPLISTGYVLSGHFPVFTTIETQTIQGMNDGPVTAKNTS